MNGFGDNPFDDGLDFVGCPPRPTELKLPEFPQEFGDDCKLICWGRCLPTPDGERRMKVYVEEFKADPQLCGVYNGVVHFVDAITGNEWYKGRLQFYYTRNYLHEGVSVFGIPTKSIAFRFIAKGDIQRVADDMPEWECLILCTKQEQTDIRVYEDIFVYGGLEIFCDVETLKMKNFMLSLGHNDGWYTHHPKCSARPIDWHGRGDYLGHYCERGWLFVAPERNFVFDPGIRPPTGRFDEEALRNLGSQCYTEEAILYGGFKLTGNRCIHYYQYLRGKTECETPFSSVEFCQGMVYSGERYPWITFFSLGYWMDRFQRREHTLHLVEGNIKLNREEFEEFKYGLYFYGFATQHEHEELKLVDLASNKDVIGVPVFSSHLLYLYNAGRKVRNPKVREFLTIDPKLLRKLSRAELNVVRELEDCPFLEDPKSN